MNVIGYVLVVIGLIVFLIGYWFLAESQVETTDVASTHKAGGIAGIVIGIIVMILGIVFGHSSEPPIESTE